MPDRAQAVVKAVTQVMSLLRLVEARGVGHV